MYAIFKSGGRQFQAKPGTVVKVNKLPGQVGEKVVLDQVLLVSDGDKVDVGKPVLEDVAVSGHIVEQGREKKIVVFKHKRRKDYRKKQGHRQDYTAVLVDEIGKAALEAEQPVEAVEPSTQESAQLAQEAGQPVEEVEQSVQEAEQSLPQTEE